MNRPKVKDEDDIHFLIATPKVCSVLEATRVQPDSSRLWREAASQVDRAQWNTGGRQRDAG